MKRFIFIILIVGQTFLLSPFGAQAEDAYIRQATKEEIQKILTQDAQKAVVDLAQNYIGGRIDKFSAGEEFKKLLQKWLVSHISPQTLFSTWNSYFISVARVIVSRYQADLWKSDPSKDRHIFENYSLILQKIDFSPKLLELHGRDSKSFDEASKVFQFLKERKDFILSIGGKIVEDGFDLSDVNFFTLSDARLEKWDFYLGKHKLPEGSQEGEEISHKDFGRRLKSLLEDHDKDLKNYVKLVEDRGLWQMLEGVYRGDKEDPNGVEIQGNYNLICSTRKRIQRLGVSSTLIDALLKKEKAYGKYVDQLLEEDIRQVKWAKIGVAFAPLVPLGIVGGAALGLSANTSAFLAGVPLAISGAKGIGSFVIQGLFDHDHFRGDQLFNDLIPGLTASLPFSAALPLFAGGISAIASIEALASTAVTIKGVTIITGSQALIHGTFYTLIGYGLLSGVSSAAYGISEATQGDKKIGILLIWDGSVDIAASLLFLRFARPGGGQKEERLDAEADSHPFFGPAEPKTLPRTSRTSSRVEELHQFSGRPRVVTEEETESGPTTPTATALLEESVPLRELLKIPETVPPDEVLFSGPMPRELSAPKISPRANNILSPVWTGDPLIDDGKEDVIIIEEDEDGNPTLTRIVRVDKGSSEEDIWRKAGGHRGHTKILGVRPSKLSIDRHGILPQANMANNSDSSPGAEGDAKLNETKDAIKRFIDLLNNLPKEILDETESNPLLRDVLVLKRRAFEVFLADSTKNKIQMMKELDASEFLPMIGRMIPILEKRLIDLQNDFECREEYLREKARAQLQGYSELIEALITQMKHILSSNKLSYYDLLYLSENYHKSSQLRIPFDVTIEEHGVGESKVTIFPVPPSSEYDLSNNPTVEFFPFAMNIPTFEELSDREINFSDAIGSYFLGLIPLDSHVFADGVTQNCWSFYAHDEGHGHQAMEYYFVFEEAHIRERRGPVSTEEISQYFRKYLYKIFLFSRFLQIRNSIDPISAELLELLWFDGVHEEYWITDHINRQVCFGHSSDHGQDFIAKRTNIIFDRIQSDLDMGGLVPNAKSISYSQIESQLCKLINLLDSIPPPSSKYYDTSAQEVKKNN